MIKNKIKMAKQGLATVAFLTLAMAANAQTGDFNQGISQATGEITGYIPTIVNLIMAIGGIVGVIGAIRIYQKWNNGDQDINKELMSFGGSALFLILAPIAVRAIFGV